MPVAAELVAMLGAFFVFLLAWMLLQGYRVSLGLLLGKLAEETRDVTVLGVPVFGWLASGLDRINHFILYNLGQVVIGSSWAWHKLLSQAASFVSETMRLLGDLGEATAAELDRIRKWVVPALIAAAVLPLTVANQYFHKQIQSILAALGHLPRVIEHTFTNTVTHTVIRVQRIVRVETRTAVATVAGTLANPWPRLRAAERDLKGIDETLRGVLRRLTPAALLGAVAVAVSALGINWTRCSGSQRYGRQLCGMDQDLLGSLIADTLLVLGTVSLVEFAQGMQAVTAEGAKEISAFWRA